MCRRATLLASCILTALVAGAVSAEERAGTGGATGPAPSASPSVQLELGQALGEATIVALIAGRSAVGAPAGLFLAERGPEGPLALADALRVSALRAADGPVRDRAPAAAAPESVDFLEVISAEAHTALLPDVSLGGPATLR